MLGGHVKQQKHNKKHRNVETVVLNRPSQGCLFTVRDETRRQSLDLVSLPGNTHVRPLIVFAALHASTNDHECTTNRDLEVMNKV